MRKREHEITNVSNLKENSSSEKNGVRISDLGRRPTEDFFYRNMEFLSTLLLINLKSRLTFKILNFILWSLRFK